MRDINTVNSMNHIAYSKPRTFRQAASLYAIHNNVILMQYEAEIEERG